MYAVRGAVPTYRNGLVGRSRRGLRTGRRHIRIPQELGTPGRFHLFKYWLRGELPDPKTPGPKSASGLVGATNTGARGGNRRAKETKRGGKDVRESEHLIVPLKPGNAIQRTRWREGGAESRNRWRETWRVHWNSIPC